MSILSVVIPAAGKGTRFAPITSAIAKEMLPILNKPAIDYIITETENAGITNRLIITNRQKTLLARYLETMRITQQKPPAYIYQSEQKGLGHAIFLARNYLKDDYFAVMLPDDIIFGKKPELSYALSYARRFQGHILAVQKIKPEDTSRYGVIQIKNSIAHDLFAINHVVEKPKPADAPSCYGVVGRYVFKRSMFDILAQQVDAHTNNTQTKEITLTDAINYAIAKEQIPTFAYVIKGKRYDIGAVQGWIECTIDRALADTQYQEKTNAFLANALVAKKIAPHPSSYQKKATPIQIKNM